MSSLFFVLNLNGAKAPWILLITWTVSYSRRQWRLERNGNIPFHWSLVEEEVKDELKWLKDL